MTSALVDRDLSIALLDLHRLLHALEQYEDDNLASLTARINLAQSLWNAVKERMTNSDVHAEWQERLDRVMHQVSKKRHFKDSDDDADQLIADIFGSADPTEEMDEDDDSEEELEWSSSEDEDQSVSKDELPARTASQSSTKPEDLQKSQQEEMERAISNMATQLKNQTSRIHKTLQSQSNELEGLERVAEDNVQQVTDVAQKVTQEVKSSWSTAIATWTLIFATIGAFVFALMVIMMAPKQKTLLPSSFAPRDQYCRWVGGKQECLPVDDNKRPDPTGYDHPPTDLDSGYDDTLVEDVVDAVEHQPAIHTTAADLNTGNDETAIEEETWTNEGEYDNPGHDDDDDDGFTMPPVEQMQQEADQEVNRLLECDMNIQGECVPPSPEGSAESDNDSISGDDYFDASADAVQDTQNVANDADPFGADGNSHIVAENDLPRAVLCQGKPFGARDVRRAANEGDFAALECFLKNKPELVSRTDSNGWNALHLVARGGDVELVELVLSASTDDEILSLRTNGGQTAAELAQTALGDDHPVIELLGGNTEVSSAESSGGNDSELGGNRNADDHSYLSLCDGVDFGLDEVARATHFGRVELVRCYLERKPELINAQDDNGWGVLHLAARVGNTEILEFATFIGGDLSLRTIDGRTPLDIAVKSLPVGHPGLEFFNDDEEEGE